MCAEKIAIIAGNGDLPALLIDALNRKNIEAHLIGFKGQTTPDLQSHIPALWVRLGQTGKVLKYLKANNIHELIMIGGMKRPKLWEFSPDWETLKFYLKLGLRKRGDDSFLKKIDSYLQSKGLILRGAYEFLTNYLAPEKVIGNITPPVGYDETITLGIQESQNLGAHDEGQSVVVQGQKVIAYEDKSGTDALIKRAANLADPSLPSPVLVKTCKPQQDKRFDLPTIGVQTIKNCALSGFGGIIVQSGATFIINKDEVAKIADAHKMFIVGISIQ